ncbi:hypothetical protein ACTO5A_23435 [Pseudomonas aeruginosa]|jgi:hypothetical protein|uniref:Conjugal transfer protein n=2 Tax=Pseudomonadaceae TaxID=135621 RepID=A0A379PHV2_ECTOL|nr:MULTISPECIES: hypothetical protein [Pseudomonas]EPL61779.1 hypothetical protein B382_15233 [Stutzerimonas stutzeri B1SMN1]OZB34736.1 MAG: hypothetical protein B7X51_00680 [Pseudomonas sp. 34-62-33]ELQ8317874.1 hypothetical protein [Pseudomonas aeruginosa]KSC76974.1 hypothetical protein AO888_03175 [Pseudomonas aeruginosa]MBI6902668.1 hypothetical protein [Pseudomonas aeruginosa]
MRMLHLCFTALLSVLAATSAVAADPYLIDQRDPAYQKSIEHLARAAQALAVARKEMAKAEGAYQLPGLNVQQMQEQLRPLEDTLAVLLAPEKKRMAHQTLVPDGIFFTPLNSGD